MKNQDARFLHPVTQRDLRQKSVELFLSGISKIEISKQLCVSRQSVYKWLKAYEKVGKTPVVNRSGNRFSCNMISTITNLRKLSFMIFHENFTSEVFLRFLKRLVQQTSRKVFLIVDRHRAHRSKQVQQWLTKNEKFIRVFYLPSYCPELNPDEFLNQDVKTHLGKKRVKNKAEMIKNLNSHLRMRQKQPDVIQNFIKGCHSEYAA